VLLVVVGPVMETRRIRFSIQLERGGSSPVGRGRAGYGESGSPIFHNRPDHNQQHCYHHAPTVKPETATAVVELLLMGVRTPETCYDMIYLTAIG